MKRNQLIKLMIGMAIVAVISLISLELRYRWL